MENPVKDQCWRLIKSLNKSEKRNFKLYASRLGGSDKPMFVQLFDLMDKQDQADDLVLLNKIAEGKSGKLSNLKRHLYQQLLASLRLIHLHKQADIEIRQMLDFARILYGKSHVLDALRMLEKAKHQAIKNNLDFLLSEVLEFQKLIEARHVTRSRQVKNKMDELVAQSQLRAERNLHTSLQSNVNIQIQGFYILNGHVRNKQQLETFNEFWLVSRRRFELYPPAQSTFFERANHLQASMWRHYILLDFYRAKEAAANCYNLFKIEADMPLRDPDFFIRTTYYVTAFAYLLGDKTQTQEYLQKLSAFVNEQLPQFNENSSKSALIYLQLARFNHCFTHHDWTAAKLVMDQQKADPIFRPSKLPSDRRNLFRYKFAAIHFALKDFTATLTQIQTILNSPANFLRDDLLIHVRLMQAIAYLETNDFYLADYAITNLSRIIRRNLYAGQIHQLTLSTLRKMVKSDRLDWPLLLQELRLAITPIKADPFEAKCLKFFDVLYWIEHHV